MKKLLRFGVVAGMLASTAAFAVENPGDIVTYGPGEGGGGDTGTSCYWVEKDIYKHSDRVVRVGEKFYYRIRLKALCDMKKPKLVDHLPKGLNVEYVSSGCDYHAPSGKVTCKGTKADAGETATVYIGVRAKPPGNRWIFNDACFTSKLGGYMCYGIWTWVKWGKPAPETLEEGEDEDKPEDLPDNGGFFPELVLN